MELIFELFNLLLALMQMALILYYPRLNLNINGMIDRCLYFYLRLEFQSWNVCIKCYV